MPGAALAMHGGHQTGVGEIKVIVGEWRRLIRFVGSFFGAGNARRVHGSPPGHGFEASMAGGTRKASARVLALDCRLGAPNWQFLWIFDSMMKFDFIGEIRTRFRRQNWQRR